LGGEGAPDTTLSASGPVTHEKGEEEKARGADDPVPKTTAQSERPQYERPVKTLPLAKRRAGVNSLAALRRRVDSLSDAELARLAHHSNIALEKLRAALDAEQPSDAVLRRIERALGRIDKGLPPYKGRLDFIQYGLDSLKQSAQAGVEDHARLGLSQSQWQAILENPKALDESTEERILINLLDAGASFPLRPSELNEVFVEIETTLSKIHEMTGVTQEYIRRFLDDRGALSFKKRIAIQHALQQLARQNGASERFIPRPFSFLPFLPLSRLPVPWLRATVHADGPTMSAPGDAVDIQRIRDRLNDLGATSPDVQAAGGMHASQISALLNGHYRLSQKAGRKLLETLDAMASEVPSSSQMIALIKFQRARLRMQKGELRKALNTDSATVRRVFTANGKLSYKKRKQILPYLLSLQKLSPSKGDEEFLRDEELLREVRTAVTKLESAGKATYQILGIEKHKLDKYFTHDNFLEDTGRLQIVKGLQQAAAELRTREDLALMSTDSPVPRTLRERVIRLAETLGPAETMRGLNLFQSSFNKVLKSNHAVDPKLILTLHRNLPALEAKAKSLANEKQVLRQ
jgi:hypothetical protein